MSKKYVIYILRTCKHYLKVVLTLKTQFEKNFMTYFEIFKNIKINIIVSRKL
jgi:hypothetical protein